MKFVLVECPDCGTPLPLELKLGAPVKVGDGIVEVPVRGDTTDVWAHGLICQPEES